MKNHIKKIRIEYVLFAISMLLMIVLFLLSLNESLWKDEIFDMQMIEHPYSYFLLTNRDLAPPVHFTILKFGVDLMKTLVPSISSIIVAKWVSLIPYIIIQIISLTYVRKKYSTLVSAIFSFCVLSMPHMYGLGIEIRQYSWSILFMLLFYIALLEYAKKGDTKRLLLCAVWGGLAACTHYYACFGIAFSIIVIFVYSIKLHNIVVVKKMIFAGLLTGVLFIPWFIVFLIGIMEGRVGINYRVSRDNYLDVFTYILRPDGNKYNLGYILCVCLIILVVYLFYHEIKNIEKNIDTVMGIAMPVVILITGTVISVILIPAFQARYIMPCMGVFWMSIAIAIENQKRKVLLVVCGFLLIVGMFDVAKDVKEEVAYKENVEKLFSFFETMNSEDVIITNNKRIPYCFSYYIDNEVILWNSVEEQQYELVSQMIEENRQVYCFESYIKGENDKLITDSIIEKTGLDVENIGLFGLEYVKGTIYKMEK